MIYGKQQDKNRTDRSDNLGLVESTCYAEVKANTLDSYFIAITSSIRVLRALRL